MINIIPYHEAYETGVQSLYAVPMEGMISLSLERKPHSLIGANIQTERPKIFIALENNTKEVVAVFNLGERRQYYKGQVKLIPYFCDLRIKPEFQKGIVLFKVIRHLNRLDIDLNINPATTIVFADNAPMLKMIDSRKKIKGSSSIPLYQKIANIETFIFKKMSQINKADYLVRRANEKDIPLMQELQDRNKRDLMIYLEFEKIGKSAFYKDLKISDFFLLFKNQNLVGMIGTWKTTGFKQVKVNKYHWSLNMVRPIYNLVAANFLGYPVLPKPGGLMINLQLHSIVIDGRQKDIFCNLLQGVLQSTKLPLMITLDTEDPLFPILNRLKSTIRKPGHIYWFTYGNKIAQPSWIPVDVVRV